jgi:hypothetical protein
LLEAASARQHTGLGALGSIIVAETILGTLARDRLPAEQATSVQRTRLCLLGQMHGVGHALSELSATSSFAGIVRFLAGTAGLKNATPALFTAG